MLHKKITRQELENMSITELDRILLAYNDGQGDHSVFTFEDLYGQHIVAENASRSEAVDSLYTCDLLTGNNSDWLYFDNNQYYIIDWDWPELTKMF